MTKQTAKKFSPEVRSRGVRMVQERRGEYVSESAAIGSIAAEIGCAAQTLRSWVRRAENELDTGPATEKREPMKALDRENKLQQPNEILRKASACRILPTIVVVCGPPCSGKSECSRMLLQQRQFAGWIRLEMDELRLALWPFSHTEQDRANAYARMHELAAEALRNGAPGVVLDATYQPSQQRHAVRALAEGTPANLIIFECKVSADEAVSRFEKRESHHAGIDLSAERVWDLADDFQYQECQSTKDPQLLDSSQYDPVQLVNIIIKRVEAVERQRT